MPSHSKQIISTNSKQTPTFKQMKQKNKRRNRKQRKQRIQLPEIRNMSNIGTANTMIQMHNSSTDENRATQNQEAVAQMWAKTYESMIRLQYQHRIHYWKNLASIQNQEIFELRNKLQIQNNCKYYDDDETSADDDDSVKSTKQKDCEESESYLKFLEITLRHRQERIHKTLEEDVE